jgi:fumarylacetoacetase
VTIDATHDPALTSWVDSANGHRDWPIQNLPLGIAAIDGGTPRPVTAIGDQVLDLSGIAAFLPEAVASALSMQTLNLLLGCPRADRLALRRRLSTLLSDPQHRAGVEPMLHPVDRCEMHLPTAIGDYTDFYVGIHHAGNIGRQLRPENPLLPNYKHIPIGYHGRASSVRVSGAPVRRPNGQRKPPGADRPEFGPARRLDYELELAVWMGPGNRLGEPIAIGDAAQHIAGLGLLNDWSARDIQAWEYQPLGPFLGKNFLTSVSPWIVTTEALAPFRIAQPPRPEGDPSPLPYLWDENDQRLGALAITIEAAISTARMRDAGSAPHRLSRGPAASMYWTIAQMVAHHSSNGCDLRPGDLLGTGTLSTRDDRGWGSLMEISRGGTLPLELPNRETRSFLEDGDEIVLSGRADAEGFVAIGLGTCHGTVMSA